MEREQAVTRHDAGVMLKKMVSQERLGPVPHGGCTAGDQG